MMNEEPKSQPTADDSQAVEKKTLAVAAAVAGLVEPVKQVLRVAKNALWWARFTAIVFVLMMIVSIGLDLTEAQERKTEGAALLEAVKRAATPADVKKELDEKPVIKVESIRSADPADPSSTPALILPAPLPTIVVTAYPKAMSRPKTVGEKGATKTPPQNPVGIELPLEHPKKRQ